MFYTALEYMKVLVIERYAEVKVLTGHEELKDLKVDPFISR